MEKLNVYRLSVYGGEMPVREFAESILILVNYRSNRKETIIDLKTLEGSNIVIVDSHKDISEELKRLFNTDRVDVEKLNVYLIEDGYDLGKNIGDEINKKIYDKDEIVKIISEEF